jgi:hypothetical protein
MYLNFEFKIRQIFPDHPIIVICFPFSYIYAEITAVVDTPINLRATSALRVARQFWSVSKYDKAEGLEQYSTGKVGSFITYFNVTAVSQIFIVTSEFLCSSSCLAQQPG